MVVSETEISFRCDRCFICEIGDEESPGSDSPVHDFLLTGFRATEEVTRSVVSSVSYVFQPKSELRQKVLSLFT